MVTIRGRRVAAVAGAAAVLAAAVGVGGWALSSGDDGGGPVEAVEKPAALASPLPVPDSQPTPSTTTTTTAVVLPAPEAAPADAYAPTPEVIHGALALPSLGVEEPLQEGVTLTAINRGPGHWPGTAMPGEVGNMVVAGHRTTYSRPFHDLDLLQPGDQLVVTMNDGTAWTYEHTSTEIVASNAMHIVDQTPEATATLFACHPKGSAAQRIVARFRLAAP